MGACWELLSCVEGMCLPWYQQTPTMSKYGRLLGAVELRRGHLPTVVCVLRGTGWKSHVEGSSVVLTRATPKQSDAVMSSSSGVTSSRGWDSKQPPTAACLPSVFRCLEGRG